METKEIRKEQEMTELEVLADSKSLDELMQPIMTQLKRDQKFAAVHIYKSALHSVTRFVRQEAESGRQKADAAFPETLFQAGTLKAYEEWLRSNQASWNTVSTYMRTLRAVYNRIVPPGTVGHNPKLFDDVYTKINSYAKRALTDEQMQTLMETDITTLPKGVQCALAYCLLMFLFRGMAFIDLAHLQKRDIRGNSITYCRHKTGKQITVRIPHEAMQLLEEFRNTNSGSIYLFPILDAEADDDRSGGRQPNGEQLYQHYLRALRSFNKKLARVAALLLPGTKLSSYTARHTWATIAYYAGVHSGIISTALGHSSIKVTETYFKPFENERVDSANDKLIVSVLRSKESREIG